MVCLIPLIDSYLQGQGQNKRLNVIVAGVPCFFGKDTFIFPW